MCTVETPRKFIISITKAIDCLVDCIPNRIRTKISENFELAAICTAITIPFLYAATNKNSTFLARRRTD